MGDDKLFFALAWRAKKNRMKRNNKTKKTVYVPVENDRSFNWSAFATIFAAITITISLIFIVMTINYSIDDNTHFIDETSGDLNLSKFDTQIFYHPDSEIIGKYSYRVSYRFDNLNSSMVGNRITVYFYNGDTLINNKTNPDEMEECTSIVEEEDVYKNSFYGYGEIRRNDLIDVTDVGIEVKNNDKIIYNETKPFKGKVKEL